MTDIGAPMDAITGSGGEGGESTAPAADSNNGGGGESTGINPAWNSVLEKLPKEFHNQIIPDLRGWDDNFRTKVSEAQSKVEPYNFLVENQIDPQRVQMALGIADLLDTDPRKFYDSMGDYYKDQWQDQGQQGQSNDDFDFGNAEDDIDITKHPKFQELQNSFNALAQSIEQDQQARQVKEADAQIEQEVKNLKEKYGDWDEEVVFSLAVAKQMPLEDAVKAYQEKFGATQQQATKTPPSVFSPVGGIPLSQQPDPAKMTGQETRQLVVEFLKAQHKDT